MWHPLLAGSTAEGLSSGIWSLHTSVHTCVDMGTRAGRGMHTYPHMTYVPKSRYICLYGLTHACLNMGCTLVYEHRHTHMDFCAFT